MATPCTKESLGNLFAGRLAGLAGFGQVGARPAQGGGDATRPNHGATVAELEAIFGWAGGQMASLYTRSANRRAAVASRDEQAVEDRNGNIYSRT